MRKKYRIKCREHCNRINHFSVYEDCVTVGGLKYNPLIFRQMNDTNINLILGQTVEGRECKGIKININMKG